MPTLSIIQAENKYAVSYLGEEHEICRMLTQCALRDELLAGAILRSAGLLSQKQAVIRINHINTRLRKLDAEALAEEKTLFDG